MASINNFTIVGNVTKDLVMRTTPNGKATTTYIVAVNNVWYSEGGVKHEECDYIPVTTYGKQAEADVKFLKKGSKVAVMGKLRSWYKPDVKKGGFNFEAIDVQYLGSPVKSTNNTEQHENKIDDGVAAEMDDWLSAYAQEDAQSTLGKPQ